jgi:hypothetical protein
MDFASNIRQRCGDILANRVWEHLTPEGILVL